MKLPRPLLPSLAVIIFAFAVACSGSDAAPRPTPTAVVAMPTTAPSPAPSTSGNSFPDGPTGPGPVSGQACPIAQELCQFASRLETVLAAGDLDAFMAMAAPVSVQCGAQPGTPRGPSEGVCEGAGAGEVRTGYWDLRAGAGLVVTEGELRSALSLLFDAYSRAGQGDLYGPGALRIGSISCTRLPEHAPGICRGSSIQVHLTFINPPDAVGTGLPSQRTSFHVSASVEDGMLMVNGIGTVVPPNSVLVPFSFNGRDPDGTTIVIQVYPWTR